MDKLQKYKKEVDGFLGKFLASKQKDLDRVNPWGSDAIEKIQGIISEGKTIRGSLVLLTHDLFQGTKRGEAVKTAAAYELIQTGLIIHDDIMDHDVVRRGKPAIHVQYKNEGLAICVGDILFFLAHELLSGSEVQKISDQIFQEVGVAQMQDISLGLKKEIPAKEEILALYRFKTARYTFSLPMMAGAMLAGVNQEIVDMLETLGEDIGILYQIQNDTIGITGDIRENKKTLAREYPIQQDIDTYSCKAEALLQKLKRHMDTSALSELLTFVLHKKD